MLCKRFRFELSIHQEAEQRQQKEYDSVGPECFGDMFGLSKTIQSSEFGQAILVIMISREKAVCIRYSVSPSGYY